MAWGRFRHLGVTDSVQSDLKALASPAKARILSRFFKTGPGQYGEGDRFLGVTVPQQRRVAQAHRNLPPSALSALLDSGVHEERLTALFILLQRFRRGDAAERARCHAFYLRHLARVNNWDLVDATAPDLLGAALEGKPLDLIFRLLRSTNLWERRAAMLATFHFIKKGDPAPALKAVEALLTDPEDLLHKAAGWMLREVGKRVSLKAEEKFLKTHAARMPRTMLRYAIERFPDAKRRGYLARKALK